MPRCTAAMWLIVPPLMFKQSPPVFSRRDPSSQRWNYVGEKWPMNFAWNARLPSSIRGSFTCRKSTTWDRRLYFPSEGRRAEDFFVLKNPTASAGFEPANLGTKGQQATSRPLKPLCHRDSTVFTVPTGTQTTCFVQCFQNSFAKQTLPTANT